MSDEDLGPLPHAAGPILGPELEREDLGAPPGVLLLVDDPVEVATHEATERPRHSAETLLPVLELVVLDAPDHQVQHRRPEDRQEGNEDQVGWLGTLHFR